MEFCSSAGTGDVGFHLSLEENNNCVNWHYTRRGTIPKNYYSLLQCFSLHILGVNVGRYVHKVWGVGWGRGRGEGRGLMRGTVNVPTGNVVFIGRKVKQSAIRCCFPFPQFISYFFVSPLRVIRIELTYADL